MAELKVKVIKDKAPKEKGAKTKDVQYLLNSRTLKIYANTKSPDELREKLSSANWKDFAEDKISINTSGFDLEEQELIYDLIRLKNIKFANYQTESKGKGAKPKSIISPKVVLASSNKSLKERIKERENICAAVEYCRDLVESNASDVNPLEMQLQAADIAASSKFISSKAINASQAKKLGMGCLTAVGQESIVNSPSEFHPRLVILEYDPGKTADSHIALVGKGITYDTGGLCLKPTNYMLDMKSDMAGSALVISVFKAIAGLGAQAPKYIKTKVTGVLALAENGFGGASYKPGDVLRAMNGKTVQVVDTDAEGRLALADALSYVRAKVKADMVFDFATLTGSIVASLGEIAAGAMTNDPSLLKKAQKSFEAEGEKIWEMPLFDEYKVNLKSEIADLAHCRGRPDAQVAGLFLKEFASPENDPCPWVHFDIAGTGYYERDGLFAYKGATGFGVKSIFRFLQTL